MNPEVETVARAIAHALGLKPTPVMDAEVRITWPALMIVAQEAVSACRVDHHVETVREALERVYDAAGETTSAEVAAIAARLLKHEDPDVRAVAASALTQRVAK